MILGKDDIKDHLNEGNLKIIPLTGDTIRENGVDLRVGNEIMRFVKSNGIIKAADGNSIDSVSIKEKINGSFVLQPNEHILIKIKEKIKMPDNLVGFCNLRSTFARLGMSIPPTIVDAGYEGDLTIGVSGGAVPIEIEVGMRFLHLVFSTTVNGVKEPYTGKYQNSEGVTGAKI